jgi:hypothetical protein
MGTNDDGNYFNGMVYDFDVAMLVTYSANVIQARPKAIARLSSRVVSDRICSI